MPADRNRPTGGPAAWVRRSRLRSGGRPSGPPPIDLDQLIERLDPDVARTPERFGLLENFGPMSPFWWAAPAGVRRRSGSVRGRGISL